jgi:hypothetical protein
MKNIQRFLGRFSAYFKDFKTSRRFGDFERDFAVFTRDSTFLAILIFAGFLVISI